MPTQPRAPQVLPFYLSRDVDVDDLELEDEDLKEEIRGVLDDTGIDEWTYLDTFFKRFNKVKLDSSAVGEPVRFQFLCAEVFRSASERPVSSEVASE